MAGRYFVPESSFVGLPMKCGVPRAEVEEAAIRCALKRALRRRGVYVHPDTTTEQLGLLDEMAHRVGIQQPERRDP